MSASNLFIAMLAGSKSEQTHVRIFISSAILSGIVTNVDLDFVELRDDNGHRCMIAIDRIEAIQTT